MGRIVEDDVREVGAAALPRDGEVAEVHEARAVAVEAEDGARRLRLRDAEGDHQRVAHRADGEEVARVALSAALADFVDLAGDHARGRDDDGIVAHLAENGLDSLFAAQGGDVGLLVLKGVVGEEPLADDERDGARLRPRPRDLGAGQLAGGRLVVGQDLRGDAQRFEERKRDLALLDVLGLVLHARFAAPADEQNQRHRIDVGVGERGERVDRVALPAVLHVDQRGAPRGEIVARREADGAALVRGDDVACAAVVRDVGAEIPEQRIRNAGEEIDARLAQGVDEKAWFNHESSIPQRRGFAKRGIKAGQLTR